MILCSMRTVLKFRRILHSRGFATEQNNVKKGIVLGVYESDGGVTLTPTAQSVNSSSKGRLENLIALAGPVIKRGKAHVFYDVIPEATAVAVVGLGKQNVGLNESEEIHEGKEAVRGAAAIGSKALKNVDIKDIAVEDMCDAQSAAEGAIIGTWTFNEYKMKKDAPTNIQLYGAKQKGEWERGVALAEAQNLARRLMEMPSNLLTPTIFAKNTEEALTKHGVEVIVRNKEWAEQMKMGAFLSVTRGSSEPPVFLEITYCNGPKDQKPIAFVGKGVTFDTGGISLKPAKGMPKMRGDMGGAACVVSAIQAAARLKLRVNVKGFIPLCENMPSGEATKPGDIVTAMNGKTIQVDNTDAEGRLILADALCYANQFEPLFTLDIATLTGAMDVALGGAATGVFSNSTPLWQELQKAGTVTGDRMWRFPLWDCYNKSMTEQSSVDVNNIGPENGGGSCKAAAFLKEFAPKDNWMHLDIAGVAFRANGIKYLIEGMTGRPTRTLVQLLEQHAAAC